MYLNHIGKQNLRSCSYLMLSFAFNLAQFNIHFILHCPKLSFYLFHCCLQLILQFVYQGLTPTSIYGCLKGVIIIHLLTTPPTLLAYFEHYHSLFQSVLGSSTLCAVSHPPDSILQKLSKWLLVEKAQPTQGLIWCVWAHPNTAPVLISLGLQAALSSDPVCWLREYHITGLYPGSWCCNSQL